MALSVRQPMGENSAVFMAQPAKFPVYRQQPPECIVCTRKGNSNLIVDYSREKMPREVPTALEKVILEAVSVRASLVPFTLKKLPTRKYSMVKEVCTHETTTETTERHWDSTLTGLPESDEQIALLTRSFITSTVSPKILRHAKFAKVAAPFGTSALLQCFIRVEPAPRVVWQLQNRQGSGSGRLVTRVLDSKCGAFVLETGGPCVKPASVKFSPSITQIQPGYYVAKLRINGIHVSDFGQYTCKVTTAGGVVFKSRSARTVKLAST